MSDSAETSSQPTTVGDGQPVAASESASWPPSPAAEDAAGSTADHPELIVGAAFAGGLLAAMILKRLAR